MQRDSDEEAWRAIVENYGDRVELDDDLPREPLQPPVEGDLDEPEVTLGEPAPERSFDAEEERFVPPPPPPLPRLPADRMLAWTGLFGSPTVLLILVVLGVSMPPWVAYLLVAAFVGGFGYLVAKMPRGPADPWDDGARL